MNTSRPTPSRPTRSNPRPRKPPAKSPYRFEVHAAARRIAKDGLRWTEDGREVLYLTDLLGLHHVESLRPSRDYDGFKLIRDQLRGDLHLLAAQHRWDHPYQTAAEENQMLDAWLSLWLRKNGVRRKFAEEHLAHPLTDDILDALEG